MELISFSVTNFRSITSAHKISVSRSTVLIGKNNEGKSNLLKALQVSMEMLRSHASPERPLRRRMPVQPNLHYEWQRDFPIQLRDRRGAKQSIFKLEFLLDQDEVVEFKDAIGSALNGTLPLELRIGRDNEVEITFKKPGKGTRSLSAKSPKIAAFVAQRIWFNYIPAVRTEKEAIDVISRMLSAELRSLEFNDDYKAALDTIRSLQQPLLDDLADRIKEPLSEFLTNLQDVKIEIPERVRQTALRRDFDVLIDDGILTKIEYKGDGVKSLAALGLLRSKTRIKGASIIAIEEPESHLHPGAIHQINDIICSLSDSNQVIITTHNPSFVDRDEIKSNIIVDSGKAVAAKSISVIRDVLGIRASDNLTNANYALVVEGESDLVALKSILKHLNSKVARALANNILVFEKLGGAGNLSYKLSLLNNQLCVTHTLLDHDTAGSEAFSKAEKDDVISVSSCTFVRCPGMRESELEDCYDWNCYKQRILDDFGVNIDSSKFRTNNKWSSRMGETFRDQGKLWRGEDEKAVKMAVAQEVSKNPSNALCQHKRNSIDSLCDALERLIRV